eukprot:639152-Hanusia_phi.AAC.7
MSGGGKVAGTGGSVLKQSVAAGVGFGVGAGVARHVMHRRGVWGTQEDGHWDTSSEVSYDASDYPMSLSDRDGDSRMEEDEYDPERLLEEVDEEQEQDAQHEADG